MSGVFFLRDFFKMYLGNLLFIDGNWIIQRKIVIKKYQLSINRSLISLYSPCFLLHYLYFAIDCGKIKKIKVQDFTFIRLGGRVGCFHSKGFRAFRKYLTSSWYDSYFGKSILNKCFTMKPSLSARTRWRLVFADVAS